MSYELRGRLIVKNNTEDVSDKFRKREFVVSKTDESNGTTFTETIKFQLTQKNCGLLDVVNIGDEIIVKFNIKGSKWEKNGVTSYFNNLDAWKIEFASDNETKSTRINPIKINNATTNTDDDFFDDEDDDLPF